MSPEMQLSALLAKMNLLNRSWTKVQLLGRGSFGSVYEAHFDGFHFAVKEVSLSDENSHARKRVDQLRQEIVLLSRLKHKNIVQYYGSHQDESRLYMLMELAPNGSLQSKYQTDPLSDRHVSKYTEDILHGLMYLHNQNVVHRDIKCANILVDAKGSAKLADFGVAKIINVNDNRSFTGSPFWMAPEVFKAQKDKKNYGLPADIWSLGCTVLEMLTRRVPYPDLEPQQALFRILEGEYPKIPDSLPRDAQDFIQKCLQGNPDNRPTAAKLLNHPFVSRLRARDRKLPTESKKSEPQLKKTESKKSEPCPKKIESKKSEPQLKKTESKKPEPCPKKIESKKNRNRMQKTAPNR